MNTPREPCPTCNRLLPGAIKADDCTDRKPRDNTTAMAAAYQVTARLLSAEQTTIWARTAGFVTVSSVAAAALGFNVPLLQAAVGVGGGLLLAIFWASVERSWAFRNHFIDLMKQQEDWLGVAELGPLTTGDDRSFERNIKWGKYQTQPASFRMMMVVLALVYVVDVANGVLHLIIKS